jgi:DNA-binding CsgD family transcriptional regulator
VARRWTTAEDELLRLRYSDGARLADIAADLRRSVDAVVARRMLLGISPRGEPRPWSSLEDRLLRAAAEAQLPATVLASRLGRSVEQVRSRRRRLGLARPVARRYTRADDALLRDGWAAGASIGELARRLGRSPDAVRVRAGALGLHRPSRRRRWTAAEDASVRDGYANGLTCRDIAAGIPGRTAGAVAARARKLGLATYGRAWTPLEDARLRHLASKCSPAEAARALGRTPEAVRRRSRRLGLARGTSRTPPRAGTRWTATEDQLLRLHAGLDPGVLALRLGRSDVAVAARLRQLGLRNGRHRSPHHPAATSGGFTAGERRLVDRELAHATGRRLLSLAQRLDRSPASIRSR